MGKDKQNSDITTPLVSVYITNYNYGKYIRHSIESVLHQTFNDFELIIIDDGSKDNSREIINEFATNPKVRIIFQENKGLVRSCNIALKATRGRFIMRLDADDILDPNALLVMTKILNNNKSLGLVFPDYYYIDERGEVIGQNRRHDFKNVVTLKDQPAHGACTMIRKRCLLGVGGYSEDYHCQDGYDLWLKFIEKHEIENVNLPLFYYRRHGENLTENNNHIIQTRAKIKAAHAEKTNKPVLNCLGVLMVRGPSIDPGCLSLEQLGHKKLIDWTIDSALEAKSVKGFIVSSPDRDLLDHVQSKYKDSVYIHRRPVEFARENTPINATVKAVLDTVKNEGSYDCLSLLSVETPFRSAMYIDKAVNTMRIFNVDSVIGVVPENDLFFCHNGQGLQPVGQTNLYGKLRLERDYMFRKVLGFSIVDKELFAEHKEPLGTCIGHVVFDPPDAFAIKNRTDLDVANFIIEKKVN